ncbi:uncharacterized protein LOC117156466 [Bombus vancouverensis nearcticus]|uniref:uncharacterized protein LOC117156466 n=1 Tax=Bombus vancouverensis nearcticus TaxID=2705178 RepID=UPI00402B6D87
MRVLLGKQENPSTGYSPRATLHRSRRFARGGIVARDIVEAREKLISEQERRGQPGEREKGTNIFEFRCIMYRLFQISTGEPCQNVWEVILSKRSYLFHGSIRLPFQEN